jgi:hypothetical protein
MAVGARAAAAAQALQATLEEAEGKVAHLRAPEHKQAFRAIRRQLTPLVISVSETQTQVGVHPGVHAGCKCITLHVHTMLRLVAHARGVSLMLQSTLLYPGLRAPFVAAMGWVATMAWLLE